MSTLRFEIVIEDDEIAEAYYDAILQTEVHESNFSALSKDVDDGRKLYFIELPQSIMYRMMQMLSAFAREE